MPEPSADFGTATQHTGDIPPIEPEYEPEYVGAHSGRAHEECGNWLGETRDELEACGAPSTHTVVMKDQNGLHEIGMCDDCGEPEDVDDYERVWTGEVTEA